METGIQKLQPYANYKASGVEWLGEIPEDWELVKLKIISKIYNGDSLNESKKKKFESEDLNERPYISSKDIDVHFSTIQYENGLRIPSTEKGYKFTPKNTSLICIEGGSAGRKIAFTTKEVCFVNKLACISTTRKANSKFIYHTLKGSLFQTQFKLAMSGLIGGVAISIINNFYVLSPPLQEQTAISEFLDDKTTKIDQAISIKQKQIELLKERRQILIHKAVTQGINPDVKLKDSGVEWIGMIPEGWEVKPLRFVGKTQNGLSKGGEYFGSGYPFLTYGDVYKDITVPNKLSGLAESTEEDRKQFSVIEGDIFFTRTSESVEEIGFSSTALETIEDATFAGFLIRFRPKNNLLFKGFSRYYFSSTTHRAFFIGQMNLVIRASLSQELLKRLPVLLPPLTEQKEISSYIENATNKIATAISLKEQEIEKLKEYKSSLIDGVVTGKVKIS
jgi:type I restriction enzyme S subunit